MRKKIIITKNAQETEKIGEEFGKTLNAGDIVFLYGDLGLGKTTFSKGVARGLGIKDRIISPTFSLIRTHQVGNGSATQLYHIDLYRLEQEEDLLNLGLIDIFSDSKGIVLIEWPEKLGKYMPAKRKDIRLELLPDDSRKIIVSD